MKLFLRILCTLFISVGFIPSFGQTCTSASLNWDALDYIPTTGYSNAVATSLSPNQSFAFGKTSLKIQYSGCTSVGENATHTGEANSYGAGEDVQFVGNGTIIITFGTAVSNVKFSVYDIDKGQVTAFSALNSGTATPLTVTPAVISTDITVVGNTVTSNTGALAETTNSSTVNVDVPGPVTSITLTVTNTDTKNGGASDKDYWLSDISACVGGNFPTSYYQVSRPFTNQPGYVLVAANKSVYMVDPATGNAKFIFSDGATSGTLNSLAYDPYNKIIYYCWSLTNNGSANASEKTLRKYDMNTGTATTVLNDLTSLGIPTFDQGVESGAAAFYDGALYLGIEGGADNGNGGPKSTTSGRESIIWRLDFTGSVPTSATEVYAVSGDTHDWSDFSINDGMLYDFNGDATTPDYHHYNLQSGANTKVNYVTLAPKQSSVGWDGKIYWVSNKIAQYNMAGGVGTQYTITANPAIPNFGTSGAPSFGDGAEAFRPQADFGDAPASYDPDPLAPAVHEQDANLRLGATLSQEWNKLTSANADGDGNSDDGLPYVRILNLSGGKYQTDVTVYNNTGANATVAAWIDFNNDGVFQTSEGIVPVTVSTNTTSQTISLSWTGISANLANNSNTFLRIRVTSASNGMTAANPTGYYNTGEVEDYKVPVNVTILPVKLLNFSAKKGINDRVTINWDITNENNKAVFELQRSTDEQTWTTIYEANAINNQTQYNYSDPLPVKPASFYRLKYFEQGSETNYSNIERINFTDISLVKLYPNPVQANLTVAINSGYKESLKLEIRDITGNSVYIKTEELNKGMNAFNILVSQFKDGFYSIHLSSNNIKYTEKLLIRKD